MQVRDVLPDCGNYFTVCTYIKSSCHTLKMLTMLYYILENTKGLNLKSSHHKKER